MPHRYHYGYPASSVSASENDKSPVRVPNWCIEMLMQRLSQNKTSPVFPTSTGTLCDPINTQKQFKRAFALVGFGGIRSHVLRKQ